MFSYFLNVVFWLRKSVICCCVLNDVLNESSKSFDFESNIFEDNEAVYGKNFSSTPFFIKTSFEKNFTKYFAFQSTPFNISFTIFDIFMNQINYLNDEDNTNIPVLELSFIASIILSTVPQPPTASTTRVVAALSIS